MTNAERVVRALGRRALKGDADAFRILGERAEGKPSQALEVTGTERAPLAPPSLKIVFAADPNPPPVV